MAELRNRDQREHDFALRLGRTAAKHRKELETRLGQPPDVARIDAGFWERVRKETEDEMALLLLLVFMASATQHGADDLLARTGGVVWSTTRAQALADSYVATSRDMLQTADKEWKSGIVARADVRDRTDMIFGPGRMGGIAVSEITTATTAGGEYAVRETVGLDEEDVWRTEKDDEVCPICRPLEGAKRSQWSQKFPALPADLTAFPVEGPPAHPGCRCWIQYANQTRVA